MGRPVTTDDQLDFTKLNDALTASQNDEERLDLIVNLPFKNKRFTTRLGLGLMVLVLVNTQEQTVDRIALSDTEPAHGAVAISPKPFRAINIPISQKDNLLVKAIETGEWQQTDDWKDTFTPVLAPEQARFNQAGAGIGCTIVYPFRARDGGALSFSYYKLLGEIGNEQHDFMRRYTDLVEELLSR